MTFTDIKQRYPRITEIIVSGFLGITCALSITTISTLLNIELHQHTLFMISMASFFMLDSYRKYKKECLRRDPSLVSILIALSCIVIAMAINALTPIGLSSMSIRSMAFVVYFMSMVYLPIKHPQYRAPSPLPTMPEKLKDMHE